MIPAWPALFEAELRGAAEVGKLLLGAVPDDWPPGEYDRSAIEFIGTQVKANWPQIDGWSVWYALFPDERAAQLSLIGTAGYFGPPDENGTVEIGYSVASAWRNRGFASEMVRALVARSARSGRVSQVQAHVRAENTPSVKVLQNCGFEQGAPDQRDDLRFIYKIIAP